MQFEKYKFEISKTKKYKYALNQIHFNENFKTL